MGFQKIYALDISDIALNKVKALLNKVRASQVHWMVEDITTPSSMLQLENIAIWHDRAVFHFLAEEDQRQIYHSVLNKIVMPGGFIIMAAFSMDGAVKCSGLPVQRYSVERLCEFFGDDFMLIENLEHTYQMPSGSFRPYVYVRFQRSRTN